MEFLSWFGYLASGIIALSMTMNSILKFRWINLFGAGSFCLYGILLGAWPVALLNGFIVGVDIFYLIKIYNRKELFDIIEIPSNSTYLSRFFTYYGADIERFQPGFRFQPMAHTLSYYLLRDMNIAGIFLADKEGSNLLIRLDYVIPAFRDFKNGKFLYNKLIPELKQMGIKAIRVDASTPENDLYFKKIGFEKDEQGRFFMAL